MIKSFACAALAAASVCVFAQNYGPDNSKCGIYYSDAARFATPPSAQKGSATYSDMQWNVEHQTAWINGEARYDLLNMLDRTPDNIEHSIVTALYNLRCDAEIARHDIMAQDIAVEEDMANSPMPGYTYFYAEDTPKGVIAQTSTGDFADVDNRPMRMALNQPRVPALDYDDVADIMEREMSTGQRTMFEDWYNHDATECDKSALLRVIKADTWIKNVPVYASTLTPSVQIAWPAPNH